MADEKIVEESEELRQLEIDVKKQELRLQPWKLGILGAIVTALSGIFTTSIQGCLDRRSQEAQHAAELEKDREEFQSGLIEKAITGITGKDETEVKEKKAINLKFLWETGLLDDDPVRAQQKLEQYMSDVEKGEAPIPDIPTPGHTSGVFPTKEGVRQLILASLMSAADGRQSIRTVLDEVLGQYQSHPRDASRFFNDIILDVMEGEDQQIRVHGKFLTRTQ